MSKRDATEAATTINRPDGASRHVLVPAPIEARATIPASFLRRKAVEQRIGVTKSTLYSWISLGEFPRPIHLSAGAVAWIASEVDDWVQARIDQARGLSASDNLPSLQPGAARGRRTSPAVASAEHRKRSTTAKGL